MTSTIDVSLLAVSVIRTSTGTMAEMTTAVRSGRTTIAVGAAILRVTAVVKVESGLRDLSVTSEVTTEAIAEVRARLASVGATPVVADVTMKSWGMDLRSGSVTTVAVGASLLSVNAVVQARAIAGARVSRLSLGSAKAFSGWSTNVRSEASFGRSTNLEAALAGSADAQTRSAVASLQGGTRRLAKRAVRSRGPVDGAATRTTVRSTITTRAKFSSGGSGNNSSESESLEHL